MRVMCHIEGSEYPSIIISFFLVVQMWSSLMYRRVALSLFMASLLTRDK